MSVSPVKILVLYDSRTGNVEQMAQYVAEGAREIQGVEVRLRKINGEGELKATPEDVLWAEGLAVGTPTNMGVISWKMKKFWDDEMGPHWRGSRCEGVPRGSGAVRPNCERFQLGVHIGPAWV